MGNYSLMRARYQFKMRRRLRDGEYPCAGSQLLIRCLLIDLRVLFIMILQDFSNRKKAHESNIWTDWLQMSTLTASSFPFSINFLVSYVASPFLISYVLFPLFLLP